MTAATLAVGLLLTCHRAAGVSESPVAPISFDELPTEHVTDVDEVIPADYDKTAFPFTPGSVIMRCFLRFSVEDILEIDEAKGVVRYQVYMSVLWPDRRLTLPELSNDTKSITLNPTLVRKLWMPDLMIYKLEDMEAVRMLRKLGSLRLLRNGYVRYGLYSRMSVSCDMEFSSYPFDTQDCHVEFGSYGYNMTEMIWDWMSANGSIYSNDKLSRKNFRITIKRSSHVSRCYGEHEEDCYANVAVTVHLQRRTMFFLWHTFLPCVLLVATSWLSMLLPPEVIPGRMVLCITSLLALLTMFTSSLTGLEVSYIRASDIWYVGCLVFDFLIILEYVVLIFIQRERKAEDGPTWARPRHIHPAEKLTKKSLSRASLGSSARWRDVDPARMDRVSRWALVVLFASFAFGYWCYYCL